MSEQDRNLPRQPPHEPRPAPEGSVSSPPARSAQIQTRRQGSSRSDNARSSLQPGPLNMALTAAMSIVFALPVMLFFLIFQRFLVGGLTLGGVKG